MLVKIYKQKQEISLKKINGARNIQKQAKSSQNKQGEAELP